MSFMLVLVEPCMSGRQACRGVLKQWLVDEASSGGTLHGCVIMVGKITRKIRMDIAAAMDKSATAQPNKNGESNAARLIIIMVVLLIGNKSSD